MRNADNIPLTPPPRERGRPALRSIAIPVQWHDRAWRPRLMVRVGNRYGYDRRVIVLDCGGRPEGFRETPLSGRRLNFRMTHNAFTPLAESKTVSWPPRSRTAGTHRGFSRPQEPF